MKEELIIAGFGGQGVMSMGKILAHSGMKEGKKVSWMPSYGPEMRGGTANCTVVISSDKIASPLSSRPDTIIVMNLPSLDKFAPNVKPGGLIILNSSLIKKEVDRDDVKVIRIPANDIAIKLGNNKVANMVLLGSYIQQKQLINIKTIETGLKYILPERRHNLIPANKKALERGQTALKKDITA